MPKPTKDRAQTKGKRNFSSFTLKEAMQFIAIEETIPWSIESTARPPSEFFLQRLAHLQLFDTSLTERSKELLVDVYCEESIPLDYGLKLWKAAPLACDELTGVVDYLLTPRRGYIDTPMLCVIEAKKDNFEQGLAQALVEMYACWQLNTKQGITHPLYAIITNGDGWRFYRYESGLVYESEMYARIGHETLLGVLDVVFALCWKNLWPKTP